jgi:hypothetical protein
MHTVDTFIIEFVDEAVELALLGGEAVRRRPGGFVLERQMHAFVTPVLLGLPGFNEFGHHPQTHPPGGQSGQPG